MRPSQATPEPMNRFDPVLEAVEAMTGVSLSGTDRIRFVTFDPHGVEIVRFARGTTGRFLRDDNGDPMEVLETIPYIV